MTTTIWKGQAKRQYRQPHGGETGHRRRAIAERFWTRLLLFGLRVAVAGSAKAQDQQPDQPLVLTTPQAAGAPAPSPQESTNKTGTYTIQQSVEFGYRDSMIHGNLNNYDTFENLTSGVRLFDYSVEMRSIDHRGIFFDNLSFINSGYGGDPNDISRCTWSKSNMVRLSRDVPADKNYWNYNLLANPLNPTTGPIPERTLRSSIRRTAMDPRRMQDYDLTLFPQSRLRVRVRVFPQHRYRDPSPPPSRAEPNRCSPRT
jgi:hypothetical protein